MMVLHSWGCLRLIPMKILHFPIGWSGVELCPRQGLCWVLTSIPVQSSIRLCRTISLWYDTVLFSWKSALLRNHYDIVEQSLKFDATVRLPRGSPQFVLPSWWLLPCAFILPAAAGTMDLPRDSWWPGECLVGSLQGLQSQGQLKP